MDDNPKIVCEQLIIIFARLPDDLLHDLYLALQSHFYPDEPEEVDGELAR